VFIKQLIS